MYEQYIQQLLTIIPTDPYIMSGLKSISKIIDGLLAAKETSEKLHLQFVKNWVISHNTSFFETIKKSGINYKDEKKKTTKSISVLKEDCHALRFFVSKCTDKKASFHYPLTSFPIAIADPSGKLYQLTAKHLFRNEFIKLSCDPIEKIHLRMQFIFTMEWQ